MRRVLHLRISSGPGGGPEKTLLNSPRFLKGSYDVRLAYIRPHGDPAFDMPARAEAIGVPLVDVPERGPLDPRTWFRLRREIEIFRPDILHTHDYKTDALGLLFRKLYALRLVTTVHGWAAGGVRLALYYRLDRRWFLPRFDRVICVSEALLNECRACGVPEERCVLVENAIDTDAYVRQCSEREAKQRLGLPQDVFLIGAAGRLSPEKGFDLLIRAVRTLIVSGHDLRLIVAGEGPDRQRLHSLIDGLGLTDRVTLLGHRTDMIRLYQAMDLYVLSSTREGLPNVVLEAMAIQTPVVATRVGGIPRLIEHGVNGLLVEPGSLDGLVATLDQVVRDGALRESMKRAARQTIEDRYNFSRRMEKIKVIYDELLSDATIKPTVDASHSVPDSSAAMRHRR